MTDKKKPEVKKVKCPICLKKVVPEKCGFSDGRCPNCEHPFRPSEVD